MKFRFVWVGKTKDRHYMALQDEYLKRLSHFVRCEIAEIKDVGTGEPPERLREIEGKRILEKVNQSQFVCLLDVAGRSVSSMQLASEVENWQNRSLKDISFVIGGADGVSAEVAMRADDKVSLSFLTLTHEMARVVLLEQLYRAYTIIRGYPYQK